MSVKFSQLGLSKAIVNTLEELEITTPTPIQEKAIPVALNERVDLVAIAQTGTGKTAAFALPIIELIDTNVSYIQAVVLAPTRELGQQIYNQFVLFAKSNPEIKIASICGGTPIKPQIKQLKEAIHIVVATPGRLIDLIQQDAIRLKQAYNFVLDEADEMVTSLKEGIDTIVEQLPEKRRTFLYTATLPGTVKQLVQNYLNKNVHHITDDVTVKGQQNIDHQYVVVEPIEKLDVLMHFLNSREGEQGIIFCKTKAAVNKLAKNLAINKFSSGALHGSLSQPIRDRIMGQFKDGHVKILVATDLAARGIDVADLGYVVHYHLPDVYETYIHRSGRTARAGKEGFALSIIQEEEEQDIPDFEDVLEINFKKFKKADAVSLEENNTVLWAKKIFKTKPNHDLSQGLKDNVKTIFHHLTKDELIEKLIAHKLADSVVTQQAEATNKKKKSKR